MSSTRACGLFLSAACFAGLCLGCAQGEGRSASPAPDAGGEPPALGDSDEAVTSHMPGDPATETNVAGIRCESDEDCSGGRVCSSSTCMLGPPDAGPDPDPDPDAGPEPDPDAGPDSGPDAMR